jgi:hypothetical protein
MIQYRFVLLVAISLIFFISCSTEKNTYINRKYHSVTAKYNGFFNANELINQAMRSYKSSYKEDYYFQIPIERLPGEKEVEGILPAMDTAISKCTKVIQNHSMPTIKGSYKKVEYNTYIDENFITVGIANYYKRNYENATRNFEFVSRLFAKDKSNYIAKLWQAKIDIELGNYSDALTNIEFLDGIIEDQYGKDSKNNKKKSSKTKSNSKKKSKSKTKSKTSDDEPAQLPSRLRDDFFRVKAEYYLKKTETKLAIESLEKAVELSSKKEKARIYFVLGQLYSVLKNPTKSNVNYSKCLQYPAPYIMHFNAKMNQALSGKDVGMKNKLIKMVKEAKNVEYRDQIYYALASIEMKENHNKEALSYLTKSVQTSTSNKRQKAMSYEKLGDLSYAKSNYVSAQKYYDSCGLVMPENYPNGENIKEKASKLSTLVKAVETANFEDSVQRIALMPEKERIKYLNDVLKQIKEEIERKKRIEEQKMQEMQEALNKQNEESGKKGYWNNNKTRQEGYNEFKKNWGQRENKDDWRRSEKIDNSISDSNQDSTQVIDEKKEEDSLTVEKLALNLPLTEEAMAKSIDKLLNAWYDAAIIYKDQLNELEISSEYFEKILFRRLINKIDLSAAFQLYRINESNSKAEPYKKHILDKYPDSDYASFIKDPEYFLKQKNNERNDELEYLKIYENYKKKSFNLVIAEIDAIVAKNSQSKLLAKFKLLKVNAKANLTEDKKSLLPDLNEITKDFPNTDESKRAQEMIDIIQKGFSSNDSINKKKSPYIFSDESTHYAIILVQKPLNLTDVQNKINTYNNDKFSNLKLKSSTLVLNDANSVVLLKEFKSITKARDYLSSYKSAKRELGKFNELKILLITSENLKKLLELKKIEEYELFHDENY